MIVDREMPSKDGDNMGKNAEMGRNGETTCGDVEGKGGKTAD